MQLLAKLKKISVHGVQSHLKFSKFFKVALNPMYIFFINFAKSCISSCLSNSVIRKNITAPFLKYRRLKLKLRVFLTGHTVAMVTYFVMKTIPTCLLMIGQFFLYHDCSIN